MEIKEVIEDMDLHFKSGNDVPVTRATITLEQWEAVKAEIECLRDEVSSLETEVAGWHESYGATNCCDWRTTEERAREILDARIVSRDSNSIFVSNGNISFDYVVSQGYAVIDGTIDTPEQLEALAFLMRNKGGEDGTQLSKDASDS